MPIILEAPIWLPPAPGVGGTTAGQLLQELGMRMGDYAAGMVSSDASDPSYLDDTTRTEPDDVFRQGWLTYLGPMSAQSVGVECRITGYDGTINVGRFLLGNGNPNAGLASPAKQGDTYAVNMRWSRRRKLAALNRAIRRLPQNFWRRIEDTSITTTSNTWTYALPPGMVKLFEVWVQASTNMSGPGALAAGSAGQGFPFNRLSGWFVRDNVNPDGTVTHTLQMDAVPPWPRALRLVGQGIQPLLGSDADVVAVGQDDYDQRLGEYLMTYAQAYLWLEGADGAPIDQASRNVDMYKLLVQTATEMRNDLIMPGPSLEIEAPLTVPYGRGWGDQPQWMSANWTPNPR